jgi:small subunit ribosomal protein S14
MAKRCMIVKEGNRTQLIKKYAERRAALRKIIRDQNVSLDEKMAAQQKMQKLPRDSNPTRSRNRCLLTGRPRGVYRRFGLGRNKLRELVMSGQIPGITKASW